MIPEYIRIVTNIYESIDVEVENHFLPSARALKSFEEGKIDALGVRIKGLSHFNSNAVAVMPTILKESTTRAWCLKSRINKLKNKKQLSYITLRGTLASKVYELKTGIKITNYSSSLDSAIEMLDLERVDAFIGIDELLVFSGKIDQLTPVDNIVAKHSFNHFIHSSKKHLLPALEKEFHKAKQRGAFKKVIRKLRR